MKRFGAATPVRVDGRMNFYGLKIICGKIDTHLRYLSADKIAEVVLIITLCALVYCSIANFMHVRELILLFSSIDEAYIVNVTR